MMEKEIKIIVKVSSEEHALIIKNDITAAVQLRTSIYHVTNPTIPKLFISDYANKNEL